MEANGNGQYDENGQHDENGQVVPPMLHQAALTAMADEVTRLSREFRRRINAQELLPALAAITALGPLLEMLGQQCAGRLWTEGVNPPVVNGMGGEPEEVEVATVFPGYL